MIILGQLIVHDPASCYPHRQASTNKYGRFLNSRGRANQFGKHWTWGGTYPHPTPMHHFGTLSTAVKNTWRAVAATTGTVNNVGHFSRLNCAVIFQLVNRIRKDIGHPTSDVAPATTPVAAGMFGHVSTGHFPLPNVYAAFDDHFPEIPDGIYLRTAPWSPIDCPKPPMTQFQRFGTYLYAGSIFVDVEARFAQLYGNLPAEYATNSSGLAFQNGEILNVGLLYIHINHT